MSKRRLRSLERTIGELRATFIKAVNGYADEYRLQVLLPFCRMHRLTFVSGNGSWSFYDRRDRPVDSADPGFKYLAPLENELNVEILGHHSLGHFMADVRFDDLGL